MFGRMGNFEEGEKIEKIMGLRITIMLLLRRRRRRRRQQGN